MSNTDTMCSSLMLPSTAAAAAAENHARQLYQRWLASWAQDVLLLRHADVLTPRWGNDMPDQLAA